MLEKLRNKFAQFGPGLLYAGAAVGVSHLVQSTRAGAAFGFQLLAVVILANVIKFPVFETGSWAVLVYMILSIATMFIIMGAISIVTSGLLIQLLGLDLDPRIGAVVLLFVSVLILGFGQYSTLDRFMKIIIVLLSLTTVIALTFAFIEPSIQLDEFKTEFNLSDSAHLLFLVALVGWMPAPIDISIWHSVWSSSKNKDLGKRISMKTALQDFHLGYWGTTFLAICFLSLGSLVLYATGEALADNSVQFSGQLVGIYTSNIGQWAFPFIALAAFTTMFSTLLTCLDAFPRTLRKSTKLVVSQLSLRIFHRKLYWFWIVLTAVGTSTIVLYFLSSMRAMVDLATTISFVVAPILASLNFVAMNHVSVPESGRQPKWLKIFNLISIGLLSVFSIWFLFY